MSITEAQIDELRGRLSDVDETTAPDDVLERSLELATEAMNEKVPSYNRGAFGYSESVFLLAVQCYENRVRGRVGVDPAGEFDTQYMPGPTSGMVMSCAFHWLPLTETGSAVVS